MRKGFVLIFVLLFLPSIVFAASLTGDCVFTQGQDSCSDGFLPVFYAGDLTDDHLFHSWVAGGSEYTVCCPGTGLGYFTSVD